MSSDERYVLIAVGRGRERWLTELGRWSTSGAAPVDVLRCLGGDEALATLGSGRRASALLVDARSALDRDLVAAAAAQEVPTVVVSDGSVHRDWDALGCAAVIDAEFGRDRLLAVLTEHTAPVDRSRRPGRVTLAQRDLPPTSFVAVLGTGGSGTSTVAMGVAQSLAETPPTRQADDTRRTRADAGQNDVLLVDGARRGELAMYHDVGDVIPGLPELVEAHRNDRLDPHGARALTFAIERRGYDLLLGRRRPADWVVLRRRAVEASVDTLARSYRVVVMDVDADLDGESETGSADVGDRHSVTAIALDRADVVLVVARPGMKGLHALAGLVDEVVGAGVPPVRVQPVINGIARNPATRAEASRSLQRLRATGDRGASAAALHLRSIRQLEDAHRSGARLPAGLCDPLGRVVRHHLANLGPRAAGPTMDEAARVGPGELGTRLDAPFDGVTRSGYGRSDVA